VCAEWLADEPAAECAATSAAGATVEGPLSGITVLDLSWVVAGPLVGRTLADFGATVVRVETSTRPDTARLMPPYHGGKPGVENSGLYGNCNAGKLGVSVDLSTEEGRDVVRALARECDVVVESFSPGLLSRWGLGYDTLAEGRPELIMLSTSITGQTGPTSSLAGYGNVGAALSGYRNLVGWPDRPPIGPFGPYTDYLGPRFALTVLLAALDRRRRTGLGCVIDVAQVEAGVYLLAPEMAEFAVTGTFVTRAGNDDRQFFPHGVFPCEPEDGRTRFAAIAVTDGEQWRRLACCIERPDLAADEALADASGRHARAAEIDAAIEQWTSGRPADDVERQLQSVGVPAHVSASSSDFCADEQVTYRNHLVRLPHPLHGTTVVEAPRYLLSDTPALVRRAAPMFGQHNREVLGGMLGYSDDRIDSLTERGVLR
jgi:crotonobetainyl-CoA:carnitine CoA-transferase CaiB-like acyl-CoA transferase